MILLAIDTAASLCAACIRDTEAGELGREVLDLGKGHAERLIGVIEAALAHAGRTYADLGAVAVSIGPGSFTGVRVGVATARGLALALKVPAAGVTTLEALALEARDAHPGRPVVAAVEGGRREIHAARFSPEGACEQGPAALSLEDAARLASADAVLTGSAARRIAEHRARGATIASEAATADIAAYARVAAALDFRDPRVAAARPKPLYMRGADAKPQSDFALPRKAGS